MAIYLALLLVSVGILLCMRAQPCDRAEQIVEALISDRVTVEPARTRGMGGGRARHWLVRILGGLLFLLIRSALCEFSLVGVVVAFPLGALAADLLMRRVADRRKKRLLRQMEFYLPSVLERVVMAVGAGMDIIPALQEASRNGRDPVSALLAQVVRLSECGAPVDSAFDQVSRAVPCVSVKHAFVHLGLAYRQGGEIVRPLKELSDATQLAYQESVEEVIAKLPVQAVLPLVVTFAGLIICFLTVPLIQVGSIARRVVHAAK
jgi:Flp pilus assembly protein TadB